MKYTYHEEKTVPAAVHSKDATYLAILRKKTIYNTGRIPWYQSGQAEQPFTEGIYESGQRLGIC